MNEQTEGRKPRVLSRRSTLIGAAAGVLVASIPTEMQKTKEGIQTPYGLFFPLYECHSKGIKEESIPENLDFFFKEVMGNIFGSKPEEILQGKASVPNIIGNFDIINSSIFEKLTHQGTRIVFGDIRPFSEIFNTISLERHIATESVTVLTGIAAFIITKFLPESANIGRRKLLKTGLYATAAWGMSSIFSDLGIIASTFLPDQLTAVKRILDRVNAFVTAFHPENDYIFLRNLVMANNMLTVAENQDKTPILDQRQLEARQKRMKPRIAYNVGEKHSGIEDLLQAGPDFCRQLIAYYIHYPGNLLQKTVDLNGGLEIFCSARVITVPKDSKKENLNDPSKTKSIIDQKFTDYKLLEMLKAKGLH